MDKKQAVTYARVYASEVIKELRPEQIVLFGSYAMNVASDESDIDIAVVFNGFNGNHYDVSTLLWKITRSVSSYIEPILLDRADDKSGFAEEVLRTGEIIYDKETGKQIVSTAE
jgi:predicted nucleotidyltransferase